MQILKEGSVTAKKEFFRSAAVACEPFDRYDGQRHCGAVLTFDEVDLQPRYWKASHSYKYYFVVVCPRCGCDCRVKDMPAPVYRELMSDDMRAKATFDGFNDGHVFD